MNKLRQAGFILIAICLALAIAGCGTAVTNNEGMESEHCEEPADTEKEEAMQIKVTDGANEGIFQLNNSSAASLYCQRRCDFVVFRRTGNVEKWRVNVYSL